jgi:chromate transporter
MIVAVAVVAQAVLQMARSLTPDAARRVMALAAFVCLLAVPVTMMQIGVLLVGGVAGLLWLVPGEASSAHELSARVSPRVGAVCLVVFFVLLVGLPLLAAQGSLSLQLADIFYRTGAMVFGGGHVVLPILEADLVPRHIISRDMFLAGYGAAQAVPGPLFSLSAFVGAASGTDGLAGVRLAAVALLAMFGSSFLLVPGVLPFWARLSGFGPARSALMGVNAAVVGLLAAAFVTPIFTNAIHHVSDGALALAAFAALQGTRLPVWCLVALSALAGVLFL